jgi:hypothetical protein
LWFCHLCLRIARVARARTEPTTTKADRKYIRYCDFAWILRRRPAPNKPPISTGNLEMEHRPGSSFATDRDTARHLLSSFLPLVRLRGVYGF